MLVGKKSFPEKEMPKERCQYMLSSNKKKKIIWKLLITAIASSLIVVTLISNTVQEILANGLLAALVFMVFIFALPACIVAVWIVTYQRGTNIKKAFLFSLGSGISVFLIVLPFLYSQVFVHVRIIFLTIAVACILFTSLITLSWRDRFAQVLIFYLLASFVMVCPKFLSDVLPYIYSPPVLTTDNLDVYNECIEFFLAHDNYKHFKLNRRNLISLEDPSLKDSDSKLCFTNDEISKIIELREKLYDIGCQQFQRSKDMILFYKNANLIIPWGSGVLYSLNDENPNEADIKDLDDAKPFIKIIGNWYMSRNLSLRGPRVDVQTSIPKALIDHSLRIDGIDPNDLTKFD